MDAPHLFPSRARHVPGGIFPIQNFVKRCFSFSLLALVVAGCLVSVASAQSPSRTVEIAAALSMTGNFEAFGKGNLEGIQLALEEAKASGAGPQIDLRIYDTTSDQ